jgi:hypothetical protein
MTDFKFPDITPARGSRSVGRWISVKADSQYIGLSQDLVAELDIDHKDELILAFDDQSRPWIGVSTEEGVGAKIKNKDEHSACVESVPLHLQLKRFAKGEGRVRLYLNGETAETELHGDSITLYRLSPESEGSDHG